MGSVYYSNENHAIIQAFNQDFNIGLEIFNPTSNSYYQFKKNANGQNNGSNLMTSFIPSSGDLNLDTLQSNFILVENFDLVNRVFSGTFSMQFLKDDCSSENYKISDGRFDLELEIYYFQ